MADTAATSGQQAHNLAIVIAAHGGGDVVLLDVRAQASWTDHFIIATATSSTHLRGLARYCAEEAMRQGLERVGRHAARADQADEEWVLMDFGTVVVHLMLDRARAFYELEKLWFQSPAERIALPGPGALAAAAATQGAYRD